MLTTLPGQIRRRVRKSVLRYGLLPTIGRCAAFPFLFAGWKLSEQTPFERQRRKAGEAYDREHHVDTTRNRATEWAADVDSENWAAGTGYAATPPDTVRRAVEMLPIEYERYVFIDLGSGKCRVPLVASEYPFKACLGVEYAPDLHEVAARNIETFTSDNQRCNTVEAHCHDAATFELPTDPLVLFFAHPFGDEVLRGFLDNLKRSVEQVPRPVYVVYYDPICAGQYVEAGFKEIASYDLPRINRFHNKRGKEFIILVNEHGPHADA